MAGEFKGIRSAVNQDFQPVLDLLSAGDEDAMSKDIEKRGILCLGGNDQSMSRPQCAFS